MAKRYTSALEVNYTKMVEEKQIERDSNQEVVVKWLDNYINDLLGDQYQLKRYKYDFSMLGTKDTENK